MNVKPKVNWHYAVRAHALMLSGRKKEALQVYRSFRGVEADGSRKWENVVIDGFAALRKQGITNALMGDVEKELHNRVGRISP